MSDLLHPQAQALLAQVAASGLPRIAESTVADARARGKATTSVLRHGPKVAHVTEIAVPGTQGSIEARVYAPAKAPTTTIVYFHGGGWVVGSLDQFDPLCRELAAASGVRVVSIAYRLAPEHPFPAAVDDAFTATQWIASNIAEGGGVIVAGDSSGGNLAAVTAIRARDRGGPKIVMQVLVYPVTDHDFETPSYRVHGESGLLLGRAEMEWFWDHYLPERDARDHPDASPLRCQAMIGLPPAVIVLAEHDPLLSEGEAYARRLNDAGVRVQVHRFDQMLHGFLPLVGLLDAADDAIGIVAAACHAAAFDEAEQPAV
jgi:acetyl esterase